MGPPIITAVERGHPSDRFHSDPNFHVVTPTERLDRLTAVAWDGRWPRGDALALIAAPRDDGWPRFVRRWVAPFCPTMGGPVLSRAGRGRNGCRSLRPAPSNHPSDSSSQEKSDSIV